MLGETRLPYMVTPPTSFSRKDLAQALRDGPFADGGYPRFFITVDGAILSYETVREHAKLCLRYTGQPKLGPDAAQWAIFGADINWEDPDLHCHHSGQRIPSAYAEPEEEPCS